MSISQMFCAVFLALLGSALAGPIDFEADPKHNVDPGRLQKDLDEGTKNSAAIEAEIELLKAAYAKTVIESPAPLNAPPTIDGEDANEMNENTGEKKDLFEGDMILTNEQLTLIETPHESNRSRRQALKDEESSWGKVNPVIHYSYSATYPKKTRGPTITAAMKFWEKNTCVRFKEVTQNTTEYRLEIRDSTGCASVLGKTNSETGIQYISLGEGCMRVGFICHELQHTFGFSHVQTRYDRDQYIDIDYFNMEPGSKNSFALKRENTWTLHNIPYEFGSNMHYYHRILAKDDSYPVMYAKPAYTVYQEGMQGRLPTFYDILAVNRHFNCAANCKINITCSNLGVQDVNNCTKCLCPMGWTGDLCKERPENTTTINVTSELTTEEISWMAENPTPNEFKVHYILLKAPRRMKVQMTPKVLKSDWDDSCSRNGIEVKFLRDPRPAGLQVCAVTVQHPTITSETNEMLVQAYSLKDIIQFKMDFKAVKSASCKTSIECKNGGIQDVNNCDKCLCPLRWTGDKCDRLVPFNLKKCKTSIACANGGVQDLKDCYKCICPVGWLGDKCDRKVIVVETSLNTTRIDLTKTAKYKAKVYVLKAPEGMKVQMTPKILGAGRSNTCDLMGIYVKFLKDPRADGLKVCNVQQPTITSETNMMSVKAYTRGEAFSAELQYKAKYLEKCETSIACLNGGVRDVKNCNKCQCPEGWVGDMCDRRVITVKTHLRTKSIIMTKIAEYKVEYYLFKAPAGMKVQVAPTILNTHRSKKCDLMGIAFKLPNVPRPDGLRMCSSGVQPTITSETNEMLVEAYTQGELFGVELKYKAVN